MNTSALTRSALAVYAVVGLSAGASAQTFNGVTVNATDSIFGAGYGDAPTPGGGGPATTPTGYTLNPGTGRVLTVSNASGDVGAGNDSSPSHGPDGYNFLGDVFNINSYRSISGIFADNANNDLALLGVFTNGTPTGAAPARVDATTHMGLASFSPLLNQTFFVGDGLTGTGSGTVQQFFVPDGATTLTLGFADAGNFVGDPGFYADNVGRDTVSFSVNAPAAVPEASTTVSFGLLLALGLGGLVVSAKRKKASV